MEENSNTPPSMTPAEYIKNRVDDQIAWYDRKSGEKKWWYERIQITIVASGVLIPLLIGYGENGAWKWLHLPYIAGFLGALVAFCEGLKTVKKYKENWTAYRMASEALQREKLLFLTKVGDDVNADYNFKLFVFKCEQIMSGENANWIAVVGKKEEAKPQKPNDNPSKPA